jgi:hypothetical protein
MWSNNSVSGSSSSRRKTLRKVANVKGYLGGFSSSLAAAVEDDSMSAPSCDVSSLGGVSSFDASHTTASSLNLKTGGAGNGTKQSSNKKNTNKKFLVEIPENFPKELDSRTIIDKTQLGHDHEEEVSVTRQKIAEMKRRWEERAKGKDSSAAVSEIEKNLFDMDNYLLSVYMNDDASVYTKTTADASFSSSSSISSNYSTRTRHRGAHHNRRRVSNQTQLQQQQCKGNWLDSMKESSDSFFVERAGEWTASGGWQIKEKKSWEPQPDPRWNDAVDVFDAVKQERLEI